MSTERDPAAEGTTEPEAGAAARGAAPAGEAAGSGSGTAGSASGAADATGDGAGTAGDGSPGAGAASEAAEAADGAAPSEAQAELAAQRELRERIARRKAERAGPIAAGGKLSGPAADLLAAVRAVESGKPVDPGLLRPAAPVAPPPAPVARQSRPEAPPRPPEPRTAPLEAVAAVRKVLAAGGAPEALAGQVCEALGERAAEELRENPWLLLAVDEVSPGQADGFARALLGEGCGPGDERRAGALVSRVLERAARQGHTVLAASAVRDALAGHGVPDPEGAVRQAVEESLVLEFPEGGEALEGGAAEEGAGEPGEDPEGVAVPGAEAPVLLGLDRFALAEESLAEGLARLAKTVRTASWEEAAAGAPSPSAAELIRAVAGHGLVVHEGGEAARAEPVALAVAAHALGLRAAVATHSENGRDRLAGCGADVVTVAGLLDGGEGPGRDAEGLFALDLLVVLDAPQLDVERAALLVESVADGGRLVLGGDPAVLWSAGPGRVFADLLAAGVCPRVVSRTPDPGPIGELVSGIGIGELNQVAAADREVVIVPVRDAGEAVHRTVQLVAESVPRAFGTEAGETQVITVGHGGSAGTRALNAALKQRLNPGPGRFGGFDPGDRVAYVPAPGRTLQATVVSADAEGLRLAYGETAFTVPRERVERAVRHGWALTAHQAAGMRWPAAVVVLPGDAKDGLSRPWVYTAFSRGERHLSVVHGVDQALPKAVAEIPAQDRTTRLRTQVESLLAPADQPG
ncbi:helix-hairpin-helix domain-containing protein [Streptomyces sp. NPDC093085]|uniref:helix-hairpin-helix domain-containing protein n=1 Tax=Streptomyces sp. NPDC093085 TaxID=3155068 RepID=UPI0034421E7C